MEGYIKLFSIELLLGCYLYYIFSLSNICKGWAKNIVFIVIAYALANVLYFFAMPLLGILLVIFEAEIFVYFYTEEHFNNLWWKIIIVGFYLIFCVLYLKPYGYFNYVTSFIGMSIAMFIILNFKRGNFRVNNFIIILLINGSLFIGDIAVTNISNKVSINNVEVLKVHLYILFLSFLILLLLEIVIKNYEVGYEKTTKVLQEKIMQTQYKEIKNIYLNMRGWRHDYHNHIQVLKASIDANNVEVARRYLNEIENEVEKVDTFVKSGNIMVDAILNSKISLALGKDIKITCDAYLPKDIFITEVDLCTLLGNVLDNAIESCEKIRKDQRFIRIYIAMVKEQFYLSVQNSSLELINFQQQHYISTKRGNHGLGMKRVAAVVSRYGGYLNVNQEKGIFATEISIAKV